MEFSSVLIMKLSNQQVSKTRSGKYIRPSGPRRGYQTFEDLKAKHKRLFYDKPVVFERERVR